MKKELVNIINRVNACIELPIIPSEIKAFLRKMDKKESCEAVKDVTHTMVCHRVGYHYDVFDPSSSGIKNKVLIEALLI